MRQLELRKSKIIATCLVTLLLSILLVLTAFAAKEKYQLEETERAWWSERTLARWKKVDRAVKYEVRLYNEGSSVTRVTVTTNFADLAKYMEEGNSYSFEVRAVAKNNTQISGAWVESEEQTVTGLGDTSGRWRNYQTGNKYSKSDGEYVTSSWYLVKSEWYYFDENGYAKTGWQTVDNQWYYLNDKGVMQTGWHDVDGSRYFFKSDGSMAVGWTEENPGQWFYMYADGKMATNTEIDGYKIDANGIWVQ